MKSKIMIIFSLYGIMINAQINGLKIDYPNKAADKSDIYNRIHHYSMDDQFPQINFIEVREDERHLLILDGKNIDSESLRAIKPENIESVQVERMRAAEASLFKNKIIIKTKAEARYGIISLKEFLVRYDIKIKGNMIFSVDEEMINATPEEFFLDENYIMKVEIINLNKINKQEDLTYIKMLTRIPQNVQKANQIYIRGIKE
jgi:hypothetical protein